MTEFTQKRLHNLNLKDKDDAGLNPSLLVNLLIDLAIELTIEIALESEKHRYERARSMASNACRSQTLRDFRVTRLRSWMYGCNKTAHP